MTRGQGRCLLAASVRVFAAEGEGKGSGPAPPWLPTGAAAQIETYSGLSAKGLGEGRPVKASRWPRPSPGPAGIIGP